MAVFLNPEDEYRRLKGFPPDHPVPISLDSPTFPKGEARNMEASQRNAAPAAKPRVPRRDIVPQPDLARAEIDRRIDTSVDRANLRQRDAFSVPALDNRIELFMKSLPGARNDVKAHIRGAESSGNFLFGAEAGAAGLSEREALMWARGAQIVQDVLKGRWPTGFDNPGDPERIKEGFQHFRDRYPPIAKR